MAFASGLTSRAGDMQILFRFGENKVYSRKGDALRLAFLYCGLRSCFCAWREND
jgi:hypothetical protein